MWRAVYEDMWAAQLLRVGGGARSNAAADVAVVIDEASLRASALMAADPRPFEFPNVDFLLRRRRCGRSEGEAGSEGKGALPKARPRAARRSPPPAAFRAFMGAQPPQRARRFARKHISKETRGGDRAKRPGREEEKAEHSRAIARAPKRLSVPRAPGAVAGRVKSSSP
jgi:hypothetical protein